MLQAGYRQAGCSKRAVLKEAVIPAFSSLATSQSKRLSHRVQAFKPVSDVKGSAGRLYQLINVPDQQQARRPLCRVASQESVPTEQDEYVVVNFFHLVDIEDPVKLVEEHKAWVAAKGLDIRGRIYYSHQGVNAQFGGTKEHALQYVDWLKSQELWKDIRYSVWPSPDGHAYPKLRLKHKPNLISLAGGIKGLPVTKPEERATPLSPAQWKEMIAQAETKKIVVLDVRNDYEWDAGHFVGAARPDEEEFNETPVGEGEADVPGPLRNVDPETPIMMYCTGGIRCDIYSTFLKKKGFKNMYTLDLGIQNYLKHEGSAHWKGSLYVFDGRMALGPEEAQGAPPRSQPLRAAVPCQVCNSADAELPHVNCANIDCNELFIACPACKTRYNGCCCEECTNAPRLLRPAKVSGGNYGSWGNYAQDETLGHVMATGRRREGRVARRERRREAMRARRARQEEERQALKAAMKAAIAKAEEAARQAEEEAKRERKVLQLQ